jgi:xylan 1,4-beta-xylosidase
MKNPILKGYNPDPSICRRGDTFYCVTSSFQWWPGLPIFASRDLRNWSLMAYGATEPAFCDLRRIDDSGGVWAPCLSYADGLFWLVFSIASGSRYHTYECRNYLTTAEDVQGPWSPPVYLNASGNDASLFHDVDGTKWLTNTQQLKTTGFVGHAGVLLQEYSPEEKRLVGYPRNIFVRSQNVIPEGSKLHRHGDFYHLVVAEGGTEYGHMMTMARARKIEGPYEIHPNNPVLTSVNDPANPIQRAGHGDIVELDDGQVAVVYLASRPVDHHSVLGRESFLARARWGEDDWLYLDSPEPQIELPDFGLEESKGPLLPDDDNFEGNTLLPYWNTLRRPVEHLVDLTTRPGWLLLKGTPSFLDSREDVAMIARRLEHHCFKCETLLDFAPRANEQLAGLACYYDSRRFYWLARQWEFEIGDCLVLYAKGGEYRETAKLAVAEIERNSQVHLGVDCDAREMQFRYSQGQRGGWREIGPALSALVLSDEEAEIKDATPAFGFTGTHVGLVAYDITGFGPVAAFDGFSYRPEENKWPEVVSTPSGVSAELA